MAWSIAQTKIGEWHAYLDSGRERPSTAKPAYGQVIQQINDGCDDDDYIVSAAGGLPGELTSGWRSKSVGSFDTEFGMSTMGYEIAGGLGAKMARPDSDVVVFVGDGSYLMMNSDIYSTVFTGHKVIFVVCDNGGFASINNLQVNQGGVSFNNMLSTARHEELTRVDFTKHAESTRRDRRARRTPRQSRGSVRPGEGGRPQLRLSSCRQRISGPVVAAGGRSACPRSASGPRSRGARRLGGKEAAPARRRLTAVGAVPPYAEPFRPNGRRGSTA